MLPSIIFTVLFMQGVADTRLAEAGKSASAGFSKQTTPIHNEALEAYASRLAGRLGADAAKISLIRDQCPEPVSFTGGYLFVSVRQMATAKDERELAASLVRAVYRSTHPLVIRNGQATMVWGGNLMDIESGVQKPPPPAFRSQWEQHEKAAREAGEAAVAAFVPSGGFEEAQRIAREVIAPPARKIPTLRR